MKENTSNHHMENFAAIDAIPMSLKFLTPGRYVLTAPLNVIKGTMPRYYLTTIL
jgi:hypothetical protein